MSVLAVAQSVRTVFPLLGNLNDIFPRLAETLSSADLTREEQEAIRELCRQLQADPGWTPLGRPKRLDFMAQDAWY